MNTWLNYHHLYYFWVTAREGSLTAASAQLRLSPSTVSAQLRSLEESLGVQLFVRKGRGLQLTERGRQARAYCDEIFGLGRELVAHLQDPIPGAVAVHLRVGVADILHKWVAHRVLDEVLRAAGGPVHLTCRSDHADRLIADVALHALDVVLSDAPETAGTDADVECVRLGALPVVLVGTPELVAPLLEGFPRSLDHAPMLMPAQGTALRVALDACFEDLDVRPRVVAEFAESALMKAFGRDGAGLMPVPDAVADEVCEVYGVQRLGPLPGVVERVYVVRPGRDHHPLSSVLVDAARRALNLEADAPPS